MCGEGCDLGQEPASLSTSATTAGPTFDHSFLIIYLYTYISFSVAQFYPVAADSFAIKILAPWNDNYNSLNGGGVKHAVQDHTMAGGHEKEGSIDHPNANNFSDDSLIIILRKNINKTKPSYSTPNSSPYINSNFKIIFMASLRGLTVCTNRYFNTWFMLMSKLCKHLLSMSKRYYIKFDRFQLNVQITSVHTLVIEFKTLNESHKHTIIKKPDLSMNILFCF